MIEAIPERVVIKPKFEERYRGFLGDRYNEFIRYSTAYTRKSIRINSLKINIQSAKERMGKNWKLEQVPWCSEGFWIDHKGEGDNKRYDIGNVLEHVLGYIYVQDAASMIPPVVLDPKPGDTVLDMCAAPGSKTSQMSAMTKNQGLIIANDLQGSRLKALGINLQRMGAMNAVVSQMAGNSFKRSSIRFDKVLVDAPCSGTGTIRRSLLNLKMWSPQLVKKLANQQKQLIKSGFEVLKKGGTMVYSTCTLEPEENEGVVSWLLKNHPDASIEPINITIKRSPCIMKFENESYHNDISRCLRIWPEDNDTEGFFIAKIRKAE